MITRVFCFIVFASLVFTACSDNKEFAINNDNESIESRNLQANASTTMSLPDNNPDHNKPPCYRPFEVCTSSTGCFVSTFISLQYICIDQYGEGVQKSIPLYVPKNGEYCITLWLPINTPITLVDTNNVDCDIDVTFTAIDCSLRPVEVEDLNYWDGNDREIVYLTSCDGPCAIAPC